MRHLDGTSLKPYTLAFKMRATPTMRVVGKRQRKRIRDAEHTAEDLARAAKRLTDSEEDLARAKTRFRLAVRRAYHKQGMSQTQIARLTDRTQQAISNWVTD